MVEFVHGEGGEDGNVVHNLADHLPPGLRIAGELALNGHRQAIGTYHKDVEEAGTRKGKLPRDKRERGVAVETQQSWVFGHHFLKVVLVVKRM
jgi:hypothetical protein